MRSALTSTTDMSRLDKNVDRMLWNKMWGCQIRHGHRPRSKPGALKLKIHLEDHNMLSYPANLRRERLVGQRYDF
jgi:hypothetical protein